MLSRGLNSRNLIRLSYKHRYTASSINCRLTIKVSAVRVFDDSFGTRQSCCYSYHHNHNHTPLLVSNYRTTLSHTYNTAQISTKAIFTMDKKEEWSAFKVRETFLNYYKDRGHTFVPSSPTVPLNDPTLLFTNAGMNQYKSIFLGTVDPSSSLAKLNRAVNSQKCIRAGGKHNDLEDVGRDSYHHTFFEMLGNWSFGDYFKKEAVAYSWELLTKVYGLDPDRLYVTYFEGDKSTGMEPDLEAKKLWQEIGVKDDHILPGDSKDNFWEMGDQGPCGPCSEIHYDLIGGGRNVADRVNQDDPMVVEVWNIVFIQFNREPDRSLKPLPNKHIDTGMGFERLVTALQGKTSNYATDIWSPIFAKIKEVTGARDYTDKFGDDDKDGLDTAYRVIADHVRTLSFAISDGGVPNNDGRGYVLRRILRRGARFARKKFDVPIGKFFSQIVPTLVSQMGDMFPELKKHEANIAEILNEEEESFSKTLDRGEKLFDRYARETKAAGKSELNGVDVWRLYDTYGFPSDLTRLMAEESNLTINEKEFDEAQAKSKEASKVTKKLGGEALLTLDVHALGELEKMNDVPTTEDKYKFGRENVDAVVKAIFVGKSFVKNTKEASEGAQIGILLNKTNFYAEQGGQEYDTGRLTIDGVCDFNVQNVQTYRGYVLHTGHAKYGSLKVGDQVIVEFSARRRWPIRKNHTGTHVLNYALREVLGESVEQKGSLVAEEKLRFDFTHKSQPTVAELTKVEDISTNYIRQNLAVYAKDVPLEIAEKIEGVRAVFGEKYPDPVRVVSVGVEIDDILKDVSNNDWRKVSIEFCGGTHVDNTGEIKDLVILEEGGIAKGIRRIVAVTGEDAIKVQRVATDFEERIKKIESMPSGLNKEEVAKQTQIDLGQLNTSTVRKSHMKDKLASIMKTMQDEVKVKQKADLKSAVDDLNEAFSDNKEKTNHILKLPNTTHPKVISDILKHVQKALKEKAVYIFIDPETLEDAKVNHACHVPESMAKSGSPATTFTGVISGIIGGKSGGPKDGRTSQSVGTDASKYKVAVDKATELFSSLKI